MSGTDQTRNPQAGIDAFWRSDRPAADMWESWDAPHRTHILTALSCIPPFQSVYEMGCGAGPNLRLILKHRPTVRVGGSDPNLGLAAWASEHLGGVKIDVCEFPFVPGKDWDVAISCYAMAYVPLEVAQKTLADLGPNRLILIEPHAYVEPYGVPGMYAHTSMAHHAHDYWNLLHATGWRIYWRWPLWPHRHGLNVVTVAVRET